MSLVSTLSTHDRCVISHCAFFFLHTLATSGFCTLSLHDALPILAGEQPASLALQVAPITAVVAGGGKQVPGISGESDHIRSEEHTSELQSRQYLVCRLLLEKKKVE